MGKCVAKGVTTLHSWSLLLGGPIRGRRTHTSGSSMPGAREPGLCMPVSVTRLKAASGALVLWHLWSAMLHTGLTWRSEKVLS